MDVATFIAVNRFGFGAAAGDVAAAATDPRAWLAAQLSAARRPAPKFAGLQPTSKGIAEFPRMNRQMFREGRAAMPMAPVEDGEQMVRGLEEEFRARFLPTMVKEVGARLSIAATTTAPFHERLTWFWTNHFTVSGRNLHVWNVAGSFEREAIRPNLDGRFVDLLLAVARHPAMICFLDNHRSVKPGHEPPEASDPLAFAPVRGLNENLAREILELHTLGTGGGYGQADVTEFALALTGWRFTDTGAFVFDAVRHADGARTILAREYSQEGVEQGEAVLRDLAAHPATAVQIATKLVRHFIADDPPPAAIEHVAAAFARSGGDLPAVHAALLDAPRAWQTPLSKLKSPVEYVASSMRAVGGAGKTTREMLFLALEEMGQSPFSAPTPQGWPDTAPAWASADSLWKRIQFAESFASRVSADVDPIALAERTYGSAVRAATRASIAQAESRQRGLALWFASPEFQQR